MISVVIPAFNAAHYIGEAIESVLAQAYRPLEVLVVDDGSSDDTAKVARAFGPPVVCVCQEHGGTASARNAGLERASASLVSFLDADDVWAADKLALQHAALAADPALEAVFGHARQFSDTGPATSHESGAALPAYTPGSMLIRFEALRRVGPFEVSFPRADVVDWYARARAVGLRHTLLPDVVLYRRIHDQNLGVRERAEQRQEYLRVLRTVIDRKRRQPGS